MKKLVLGIIAAGLFAVAADAQQRPIAYINAKIIPIVGEPIPDVCATPDRRLLVTIGDVEGIAELRASGAPLIELSLEELHDVGAQVLLWEVAVALAGKVLGINPFDQPDVEAAKAAARELLDADAPPAPPVAAAPNTCSSPRRLCDTRADQVCHACAARPSAASPRRLSPAHGAPARRPLGRA